MKFGSAIRLLLVCVILASAISGARIQGAIYDHNLEPIKKAIVTINSTPEQSYLSQYGGYHFVVDPGSYELTVTFTRNQITKEIARDTFEKDLCG